MSTRKTQSALANETIQPLYMALELSKKHWKIGFTIGMGQRPRIRTINARDLKALKWEIQQAYGRFKLPETTSVLSCYEAGRDGFYLHRYMQTKGIHNLVVDSASIEVNRRARRAKSDNLDVGKLLGMLIRYHGGEMKVWRIVNVPSVEAEDSRHLHREMTVLKGERTRHINRIKGLLFAQGICMSVNKDFLERLEAVRIWDGGELPKGLRTRLEREYQRIQIVNQQIHQLEAERTEWIRTSELASVKQVQQLMQLKGIGVNSAWLFVMEFFSWRAFRNRREVGALAGLTPTPYNSGNSRREQGIRKAGNRHIRAIAIEIAWNWLRYQPNSKLSRWYQQRFGQGNSRLKRIGIVALARKLLVDLWRYLETGALPEGAITKAL